MVGADRVTCGDWVYCPVSADSECEAVPQRLLQLQAVVVWCFEIGISIVIIICPGSSQCSIEVVSGGIVGEG